MLHIFLKPSIYFSVALYIFFVFILHNELFYANNSLTISASYVTLFICSTSIR